MTHTITTTIVCIFFLVQEKMQCSTTDTCHLCCTESKVEVCSNSSCEYRMCRRCQKKYGKNICPACRVEGWNITVATDTSTMVVHNSEPTSCIYRCMNGMSVMFVCIGTNIMVLFGIILGNFIICFIADICVSFYNTGMYILMGLCGIAAIVIYCCFVSICLSFLSVVNH